MECAQELEGHTLRLMHRPHVRGISNLTGLVLFSDMKYTPGDTGKYRQRCETSAEAGPHGDDVLKHYGRVLTARPCSCTSVHSRSYKPSVLTLYLCVFQNLTVG